MTGTGHLVLKISVRDKWQFTLIRKKLTPRAGRIQWLLNKLEDGTDRNKKKLNRTNGKLFRVPQQPPPPKKTHPKTYF